MPNTYKNKVVYNGSTLIDLTTDTAVAADVAQGKYFHLATGERVAGTASGGGDVSLRELICPQQTVTPSSYEVSLEREEGIVIGGHYVVTYDGTEYLFTAGSLWGGNGICLGEQTLNYDHSARNDEIAPFLLWETFNDVTRTPKLYAKDNNSHAIKVERIDGDSVETTNICPQQTVTTNSSYIGTLSNTTAQLVVGDYYLVTYDGTEWMFTAASLFNGDTISVGDDAVRYDHVADDNIYPFWIYNDGAGVKFYALDASASHTVKIDRITEIPDSIALTTKSIASNGTYRAVDDGANGYSSVTVNVPTGSSSEFVVTMTLGQDDLYYPDCTYAEARQALSDNKTLVFFADSNVACSYDWDSSGITYFVDILGDAGYGDDVFRLEFRWTSSGVTFVGDEQFIIPSGSQSITTNDTYDVTRLSSVTVSVPTGGSSAQTATGTFTGNGTRTIDISSVTFEPDIVYFTSNPGTTASSGTVAAIIVRDMMTATRYRNNSTTNSHYAIPDIADLNTSGSSYSWRATYDSTNSKLTLYCYSNNARALLTNGRTYTYKFVKWT